jgi:hypothetical protein
MTPALSLSIGKLTYFQIRYLSVFYSFIAVVAFYNNSYNAASLFFGLKKRKETNRKEAQPSN